MPCRPSPFDRAARWALCIGLATAIAATPAGAATYNVTKTDDTADGACTASDCSLREAVIAANANPGADLVQVPADTYTLTRITGTDPEEGDLDVLDPVTIRTPSRETDPAIIQTDLSERLVEVAATGVTLRNLVLLGGGPELVGGGIHVADGGVLTLEDCEVRDSQASLGGGIFFEPSAQGTLIDTIVAGNSADELGGGIYSASLGSLTLIRSTVENNDAGTDGGGLMAGGTVTISHSLVSGNDAGDRGGGLRVSDGTTTILDSTIASNDAVASGGGISVGGTLVLRRSFVGANQAIFGGGIHFVGMGLEVESSTFTLNTVTGSGGALYMAGTAPVARLSSSTLVINLANSDGVGAGSGGGVYALAGSPPTLHNTIIANNLGTSALPDDCSGELDSLGYNLIETMPPSCLIGGVTDGNLLGVDPMLDGLAMNGGPTLNFQPLAGSPLIEAGDPAGCVDAAGVLLATDQRGFPRHVDDDGDGDPRCDIGAVERSLFSDGFETGDASRWSAEAG